MIHPAPDSRLRSVFITTWTALACVLACLAGPASAGAQMPDMKQMSGIPRPVDDLPNGSVSVRVIRGDMSNNIADQPVEMRAGNTTRTVKTDAEGRAQFDNLDAGTPVKFSTVVDGERLESQEFPIQPRGGARLLLVATDANAAREAAARASAPAVRGTVIMGGESRIIVEPGEDTVSVFYVLDIVNGAASPVTLEKPFVFTLPAEALGTTVIQGSSPLASNKGREVSVAGPFPPGTTAIQVAADYPIGEGTVDITQVFPAPLQQVVVIAKKSGALKLASPQFERNEESVIQGTAVVLGIGKDLPAGQPFAMTISGLPHHSSTPRTITLALAAAIVIIGAWAAFRPGESADRVAERKRLVARREKLFQDLVRLEHDHRRGKVEGARYSGRREELLQNLEHVYGALDEGDAGPEPANRAGVAA
ncbi:MAG TPA: hypothetical protein VM032_16925 [Vicinamibacterales bacterium]|nr:hypothetical protein [Vicinamibacterales bacterium]